MDQADGAPGAIHHAERDVGVERALLVGEGCGGRAHRRLLERATEAFEAPVPLGMSGRDAFGGYAEFDEADGEVGELVGVLAGDAEPPRESATGAALAIQAAIRARRWSTAVALIQSNIGIPRCASMHHRRSVTQVSGFLLPNVYGLYPAPPPARCTPRARA